MCGSDWAWASSPNGRSATTHRGGDLIWRPLGHLFGRNIDAHRVQARRLPAQLSSTPLPRCCPTACSRAPDRQGAGRRTGEPTTINSDRRFPMTEPTVPHARRHQPPAAGRHHHLHRDVGAGAAARRRQPRPGLSRLRLRSAPCSTPSTSAMRSGLNQYPPMAGVPALREAVAAKVEVAVRTPLRPGHRDHHHRRRHAGDHHGHPGGGAPGR